MKLNIGCGKFPLNGWINLDMKEHDKVDIIHDLNKLPLPFDDNSFDEILASHVLEHIYDYPNLIFELYRILKSDGLLMIKVPYGNASKWNNSPYHVRFFFEGTLDSFYNSNFNAASLEPKNEKLFKLIKKKIRYSFWYRWHLKHYFSFDFPEKYNFPLGYKAEIEWKLKAIKKFKV